MEAGPMPPCGTYNQDDATGLIRLNALRLKGAAKVQRENQFSRGGAEQEKKCR
jgi:hypothetical protein